MQTITVDLPDPVYQQLVHRTAQTQRSLAAEIASLVKMTLPVTEPLPIPLAEELEQLTQLSDEELWQTARLQASTTAEARMAALLEKQQREALLVKEREEAEDLANRFDRIMLLRAKAAVLLQQRGFDISELAPQ